MRESARLNTKLPDGSSRRDHIKAAARQGSRGAREKLERERSVSMAAQPVLEMYWQLRAYVEPGMASAGRITWVVLDAYQRVMRRTLRRWERDAILAADLAYAEESARGDAAASGRS